MSSQPSKKRRTSEAPELSDTDAQVSGESKEVSKDLEVSKEASKTPVTPVLAVLGLGNPGGSLKRERHSLGARVAAALVQTHKASMVESKVKDQTRHMKHLYSFSDDGLLRVREYHQNPPNTHFCQL